jgi:hypothetical protein
MIRIIYILALSLGLSGTVASGDVLGDCRNEHTAVSVAPYLSDFLIADVAVPTLIQVGRQATGKAGATTKPLADGMLAGMLVDASYALIGQGGAPFKWEYG